MPTTWDNNAWNRHALPDCRMREPKNDTMGLWQCSDGSVVRVEAEVVYCGNCGKPLAHVPKDNTVSVFLLCRKCYDSYGEDTHGLFGTEDEFNRAVEAEMDAKFGRSLTDLELFQLTEQGRLPRVLELLARESPYPQMERK